MNNEEERIKQRNSNCTKQNNLFTNTQNQQSKLAKKKEVGPE
jgi:hypothetical protein